MKGKYDSKFDGQLVTYWFSPPNREYYSDSWKTEADSLAKAIRRFRVGCLYPHNYVDKKKQITDKVLRSDGYSKEVAVGSTPGATVGVFVTVQNKKGNQEFTKIAEIPVEGDESSEFSFGLLPEGVRNSVEEVSTRTDLMKVSGGSMAAVQGLSTASRKEIEKRMADLQRMQGELSMQKRVLEEQVAIMKAEVHKRLQAIWMIELYIGTKEEIKQIAEGQPAPAETPISVRQTVLCMDEELALYDFNHNPERIGKFDFENLGDFDEWLTSDPTRLEAILPEKKGMIALRVRRKDKDYHPGEKGLAVAFMNAAMNEDNHKTYLLIRNGENLYRIWADIQLWPHLFPLKTEFDPVKEGETIWPSDEDKKREQVIQYIGGMLAVQGLIDRSTVFHPLPQIEHLSLFNPEHQGYFNLIRDAEGLLTDDTRAIDWNIYRNWLKTQVAEGVRIHYIGGVRYSKDDPLHGRTGIKTIWDWPSPEEVYIAIPEGKNYDGYQWSFKYQPGGEVRKGDRWSVSYQQRKNRVRFRTYSDEVLPIDAVSWRVLSRILNDRNMREDYARSFPVILQWAKNARAEESREKPFADLVLQQAGVNPFTPESQPERERVCRLIRWWKLKTKEDRSLKDDEPKALRMILKAFKAGQDFDDDPEKKLLEEVRK